MKIEYLSPECKLICFVSKDPVALIVDFDDLKNGSLVEGRGESVIVSNGDIEIDIG